MHTLHRGVMYLMYLAWAYTPEALLHDLGITYYPDKYWALAVPIWICVTVLYGAWMYEGINRMSVKPTDAVELMEDSWGIPRRLDGPDPPVRGGNPEGMGWGDDDDDAILSSNFIWAPLPQSSHPNQPGLFFYARNTFKHGRRYLNRLVP